MPKKGKSVRRISKPTNWRFTETGKDEAAGFFRLAAAGYPKRQCPSSRHWARSRKMLPRGNRGNVASGPSDISHVRSLTVAFGAKPTDRRSFARRVHEFTRWFCAVTALAPLACISLASPAAVATGGVQPKLNKAEESATSEPDSRS
jgi:hypothetical protein